MPKTSIPGEAPASKREGGATESLLGRAAARRAPLGLLVEYGGLCRRFSGELLGASNGVLEIRLEAGADIRALPVECSRLQARFELDNRRYSFETRLAPEGESPRGDVVRIVAPATLRSVDRRRTIRRRLRRAAPVVLISDGPGPKRTMQGAVLNLSSDGLACRIRRSESGGIRPGRTIRALFNADAHGEAIELTARVVSMTPAGTRDHQILGLEFVVDDNYSRWRDRLCAVVTAPGNDGDRGSVP
jgi:c-di-GMP-binding flagellar brake protein YcgR